MRLKLIVIGKTNSNHIKALEDEYIKRLSRFASFEMIVIPNSKQSNKLSKTELQKKESTAIEHKLSKNEVVFLLDESGKEYNSVAFANFMENKQLQHLGKTIVFVVGGAYGFPNDFKRNAAGLLSLSKMTFSHQIIRPIFLEQLYRAFTIINGHPYHNA